MCLSVSECDVTAEEWKEWWCKNSRARPLQACRCCGCISPWSSHTHTHTPPTPSHHCQTLVTPCYLTWPSQINPWCKRQCSCCNLGQAIYKASSQVQAQGARGRQRDGRIKECLQGKETDLQSVGEKERGRTEAGGVEGIKVVRGWVKIERNTERERSCQVQRTAWIPEHEQTPAINCKWHK